MKNLFIGGALTAAMFLGGCGKADEAVKELEALKTKACACKDAECASKVQEDFGKWAEKHKSTKGSSDQAAKIGKISEGMMECMTKAMGAGGGAEPADDKDEPADPAAPADDKPE